MLDFLKGISIIAIALYHFGGGILPYGYLGVDVFFVVGGYLFVRSIDASIKKGSFDYWKFMFRKIIRLFPLVLLVSFVSLLLGYSLMLPDDYENLVESVIASCGFSNNVLQAITTKNYWDVVNMYKPLMHLWYVGVLMKLYVVLPLIYIVVHRLLKRDDAIKHTSIVLTVISLILFISPLSSAWKFYFFPFRIFEFTAGGILVYMSGTANRIKRSAISLISGAMLAIMLLSRWEIVSNGLMVLMIVVSTELLIWETLDINITNKMLLTIGEIGKRSYSIYIWHQFVIAFLFYSVFQTGSLSSFIAFIMLISIISLLTYRFIEIPIGSVIGDKKKETAVIGSCVVIAMAICIPSLLLYQHAGVVRDVPELNISKDNVRKNMHKEYSDRPYDWDRDFKDEGTKILVLGNSFGRDWANILYEYDNTLNISYLYYSKDALVEEIDRVNEAKMVFYAMGADFADVPNDVIDLVPAQKLFIVGNKRFGESNGIIYARRTTSNYFESMVEVPAQLYKQNKHASDEFGDHYIDMLSVVSVENGKVRVFTDDNMFISQDCRHLTRAGAVYYARTLDLQNLIN